jgi:polar amino acid transport system substrate-binding protein/glutamate/aspartate transport system substrate-binding protein
MLILIRLLRKIIARSSAKRKIPSHRSAFAGGLPMGSPIRFLFWTLLIAALGSSGLNSAAAGTIDKLRQDKTLRIAYREDAPPFSFKDDKGEPAGFMVDLCRSVSKSLASQLGLEELKLAYVPVTAASRFDAIETGQADLLCEPTTATLSRREHVSFTVPTFVDGASLLVQGDGGPHDLYGLAGKKIGVLGGTTTQQELVNTLAAAKIVSDVVPAKTHDEGIKTLLDGGTAAYFGDRGILMYLAARSGALDKLRLANANLTIEPYALALPRGDEDFRLAADRALSRIYRSGEIAQIFAHYFGANVAPSDTLKTLYMLSALPE